MTFIPICPLAAIYDWFEAYIWPRADTKQATNKKGIVACPHCNMSLEREQISHGNHTGAQRLIHIMVVRAEWNRN